VEAGADGVALDELGGLVEATACGISAGADVAPDPDASPAAGAVGDCPVIAPEVVVPCAPEVVVP